MAALHSTTSRWAMTAIRLCITSIGEVAPGALLAVIGPNGAGKSTLLRGIVGILASTAASISAGSTAAISPICRRVRKSAAASRSRCWTSLPPGCGVGPACSAASARRRAIRSSAPSLPLASTVSKTPDRRTLGRPDAARAVCARAAPGRAADRAGRALQRHRQQDHGRSAGAGEALAWRGPHRARRVHDMEMVRTHFSETLVLARGPVAWGPTAEVLTPENLMVAMRMCEAFDDGAAACSADDAAHGQLDIRCSMTR